MWNIAPARRYEQTFSLLEHHRCASTPILDTFQARFQAAIAQLVARRSHNPKVVSSILTGRISACGSCSCNTLTFACSLGCPCVVALVH